jgi:Tol biopolymer transport system component
MKNFWIAFTHLHSKQLIKTILILSVVMNFLFACNSYGNHPGITFISSPGKPPAESIVWSPTDANQVLVVSSASNHHNDQLFVLNTKTLKKTMLQKNEGGKLIGLDWSPDGKHVLFASTSGRVDEKGKTFTMSTNGDDRQPLPMQETIDAAWSPDGKTIAYFSFGKEIGTNLREINLHLMDINNNEDEIVLTLKSDNSLGLSCSPDGKKLVFALGSLKSSNLFVLNLATREVVQLTNDGLSDSPVWSPKGDVIAYHRFTKDGLVSSLSLIRSDGSCEAEIPNLDRVGSPAWLPDGKTLGFVALDGIYTLDLEKVFSSDIYQGECPSFQ